MQNLLSSARRPEARRGGLLQEKPRDGRVALRVNANHETMLCEMQDALSQNGIAAEPAEILQALCDALAVRPGVYRGLLAAYLLTP